MRDQGTWISLERAVAAIHAVVGGAPGHVYQTLISICADGLVRARWTGHYSRTQPAIHKRDWVGADIDWSTPGGRVVKADGTGMAGVDFSEEDLNGWRNSLSASAIKAADNGGDQTGENSVVPKPSGVPTNRQAELKAKCIEWIKALSPTPPRAKSHVLEAAMESIPGLSERQAKAAWDDAAPAAWKKPGPK